MYYFQYLNRVKAILIDDASLKSFYSSLGFTVIKDFATSTTFEAARRQFHYDTGNSKSNKKTILACSVYPPSHNVLHFFMTIE